MLRSHINNLSYESTGVEDLYQLLAEEVQSQNRKLDSLAWLLSGSEKELFLCEIGSKAGCLSSSEITICQIDHFHKSLFQ